MATVKKTITVTTKQNDWIRTQVEKGDFANESDYIRQLLRKDQSEQSEYRDIKAALEYGLESGESKRTLGDIWSVAEAEAKDEDL